MPSVELPNGSAGGCLTVYAALWRHKPFNLHYFRPCFTAPFHPHFRSLICLRTPGFLLISPNWLTQGRILPSRLLYPVLQNNGTRCHTQAHTAVSVPFPFHCPATFSKSEDGHMRLQFRLLPCKLLNPSKSSGIFLDLLLCQGNEITIRGIPADKKWTADDIITIPAVRLHSI